MRICTRACWERLCPKSRLDESGTEPVAVATGYFTEITRLLPQAVPYQLDDPEAHLDSWGKAAGNHKLRAYVAFNGQKGWKFFAVRHLRVNCVTARAKSS